MEATLLLTLLGSSLMVQTSITPRLMIDTDSPNDKITSLLHLKSVFRKFPNKVCLCMLWEKKKVDVYHVTVCSLSSWDNVGVMIINKLFYRLQHCVSWNSRLHVRFTILLGTSLIKILATQNNFDFSKPVAGLFVSTKLNVQNRIFQLLSQPGSLRLWASLIKSKIREPNWNRNKIGGLCKILSLRPLSIILLNY